jgi:ubiquitin C
MQLYIKTLCGRVFTVMVHPYDTILDIREKIEMKEGISPDMQTLYFHGLKLDDGQLMDYHITRDSMLYLTLRLRGG